MVVFTCEHCGESIKKLNVAKHYETVCRNRQISVTCVDCSKVFVGSKYDSHGKCISEEHRYCALRLDSNPTLNNGDKKQLWDSCVERCLKNPNLTKEELELLEEISKRPNVPRKKVKFINFMKNSFKPQADAAPRIFDHIDAEFKKLTGTVCRNCRICETCVDCLKMLVGWEYDSHIKFISEEHKYSALALDSNPILNKGDKKQLWDSCVELCLKNPNLTKEELELLQEISKRPNVPRKKVKFINFMQSAFRPQADAAPRIFDLIEAEYKKLKETDEKKNGTEEVDLKKEEDNSKSPKKKTDATSETNGTDKQSSENQEKKRKNESVDELTKKELKKKKRESVASSERRTVHLHVTNKGFQFDWTKAIVDSIKTHGSNNIIPYTQLFELTKEKYHKAMFLYYSKKISNLSIEGDNVELKQDLNVPRDK